MVVISPFKKRVSQAVYFLQRMLKKSKQLIVKQPMLNIHFSLKARCHKISGLKYNGQRFHFQST